MLVANPDAVAGDKPSTVAIDKVLHAEWAIRSGAKVTFEAPIEALSFDTFIARADDAYLVTDTALLS